MAVSNLHLVRDGFGRLNLRTADGSEHQGITLVRAFPIAAPEEGLSFVDSDGHEVAWVDRLAELPQPARALVDEELGQREFVPEIRRIGGVSSYATPSTWTIETDRGNTQLTLKAEEDIRRLPAGALLVSDSHGLQYLIRDRNALDKASRKILDRFL